MPMTKAEIRKVAHRERAALSSVHRENAGEAVLVALFDQRCLNLLQRFHNFASYISMPEEFPTKSINHQLFHAGRHLAVPRFDDAQKAYAFNAMPPGCPLRAGPRFIPEPEPFMPAIPADLEVIFVPGLAFNYFGQRIGYGAGIYDRLLLKTRRSSIKIGLAFDLQLFSDEFPQEEHDICVDYVVTDRQIVDCRLTRAKQRNPDAK